MRVYRITRCGITLSDTWWYSIERFGLLGYVREVGLVKTFKQLRSGVLSFNPYKLRRAIRRLKTLDKYMIYGIPIIGNPDMVVKMSLKDV